MLGVVDLVVVEFDVQGGSRTTIDNGGNAARAAQAAARTRPLDATRREEASPVNGTARNMRAVLIAPCRDQQGAKTKMGCGPG
ncbi:hypothetical protein G6F68_016313 [Rhizopus microsporus]|nr:hypothetical protein G6F68_016313 [Rhizopus microsporus]